MVESISNSPSLAAIRPEANAKIAEKFPQKNSSTQSFGPAVEVNLSKEALAFLEEEGVALDSLSDKSLKELDGLFKKIDKLFDTVGEKPLSAEQEKQLHGLEKKVESIVGPLFEEEEIFEGLSEEAAKQLEGVFGQIDKIFEKAGDKPLSVKQQEQLEALENKVDSILGEVDEDEDIFEGLSEQAAKELEGVFGQIDKIFEKAGDNPLSAEQEKQLAALDKKVESILGEAEDGPDIFEGLSEKASKELNAIFEQIDQIFEKTGENKLSAEQEKQLDILDKKIAKILGE